MKRSIALVPFLFLLTPPAEANGFAFGSLAGSGYCNARSVGESHERALQYGIQQGWSSSYVSKTTEKIAIKDMTEYITRRCNHLWVQAPRRAPKRSGSMTTANPRSIDSEDTSRNWLNTEGF